MATSNSFDFTTTRNEVIKDALIGIGVYDGHEDIQADDLAICNRVLNRMIKHMQTDARQLWVTKVGYLFLQKDQHKYTFQTDHIADSLNETEMRAAGAASATTLEVDSTTGMTASDSIGIVLDDGTLHWDTVASVTDGDTVVITSGLESAAAIDAPVFWYTNKIQDPLRVTQCVYHYHEGNDARMEEISREEYWNLANKTQDSRPSQWYFDAQLSAADLYLYGEPEDVKDYIIVHHQKPYDDMDNASNNFSFPNEALETIVLQLERRLCPIYRVPTNKSKEIRMDADRSYFEWKTWDRETATLKLQPKYGR